MSGKRCGCVTRGRGGTLRSCILHLLALLRFVPAFAHQSREYTRNTTQVIPWISCAEERGAGSQRHAEVLELLNGRRLAFVGDSLTRYQYLELAYYIAHGKCPDPDNPGEHGYILNLYTYPAMHLYLQESPKAVSKDTEEVYAKEFVFGSRVSMGVGYVKEDRTFMYMDAKGRSIEMVYLQYFHEVYSRIQFRLKAAENFRPTDVLLNFGVWFVLPQDSNTTCGDIHDEESSCPYMPELCEYFGEDHSFNLYWMSSSPSRDTDDSVVLNYSIGRDSGHNLNPVNRCDMSKVGVVDREEMVSMLEPDKSKQYDLFWDRHHFKRPDPYHAMNWDMMNAVLAQSADFSTS